MNHSPADSGPGTAPSEAPVRRRLRPPPMQRRWAIVFLVIMLFDVVFYGPSVFQTKQTPTIALPYSTFITQARASTIGTAHLTTDSVSGNFTKSYRDPASKQTYTHYTASLLPVGDAALVPLLLDHQVQVTGGVHGPPLWLNLLSGLLQFLPFLLLIGLVVMGTRAARTQQQGMFSIGKSRAKLYTAERPSTTFADVAGVETAKAELREEVDFLRDPTKYQRLGARIPKGALLIGPPGTGKTLLARAVAGEARVPFFTISATEFVEMFVGVGASRVRDLFEKAKAAAPSIVFIDEIDAVGRRRSGGGPIGGNDERDQTLNQLLVCMDGFEPNQAVIVLAATNRPDVLDPALLRPGRFDRQVTVDPPDRQGRAAILRIHTRSLPLDASVDLETLAQGTPGMSGADLANLANEAALNAARRGVLQVSPADFENALDRITLGAPGAVLLHDEDRRIVAYHEAGHALVASLLPHADPVHRVTITPRGRSLGVTQFRPIDDRRNYRRAYLLDRLVTGLGGRTAEEVACGDITTGAQNDLQEVARLARAMVTQLGMAVELGPTYLGDQHDTGGGLGLPWEQQSYSEKTARRIDAAVERLIGEAHERAHALLSAHRSTLDAIATALVREESLDGAQVSAMLAASTATPAVGQADLFSDASATAQASLT